MAIVDLVLFDMAGTTVEDAGQVPAAFTAALERYGMSVSAEALRAVRGASKRAAIRQLIEQQPSSTPAEVTAQTEVVFAEFRQQLLQAFARTGLRPVDGAGETFAWLRRQGVKVALNTGFDRETVSMILETLGWDHTVVDAVVCGDDVSQGRPAPYLIFRAMETTGAQSVHRVAVVGDTVLDLQAGYNAGVHWNIGVLSGAHSEAQLKQAPHTHLLPSVAALPVLW